MPIYQFYKNAQIFNEACPAYTEALKKNGYNTNLQFDKTCTNKSNEKNKTRKWNITWFNPPFNINVATNVAKTFLSLIDKHFPKDKKLSKIFNRNGSAEKAVANGGSGVYIEMPDQKTIESSIPTGTHCSNHKAELEAIKEALIILERITPSIPKARAVLLSDSRSVLEKLEDSKGEERQYLAKCLGNVVRNTESLVLQWIPAHCRIEGNERADRLAKEGSVLEQIESDLTYREVKSIIKSSLNNKWKESHLEYNKQDGVYCLNRRSQTTIFRLRTGHN